MIKVGALVTWGPPAKGYRGCEVLELREAHGEPIACIDLGGPYGEVWGYVCEMKPEVNEEG